jgi:hypothetical protein
VSYAGAQPDFADFVDDGRCPATRFDVRCQLEIGHGDREPHVAMARHRSSRRNGYAVWTTDGRSAWQAEVGPRRWAPTFPRVA